MNYNNFFEHIFSIKNNDKHKILTLCAVKFKIKNKKLIKKRIQLAINNISNILQNTIKNKTFILYFDHSLGGGTETYFDNQVRKIPIDTVIIRIQYMLDTNLYNFSIYTKQDKFTESVPDLNTIFKIISKINFKEIILNNIVTYPEVKQILDYISQYKKTNIDTKIIVKGHDFYSICPSWNLLDLNNKYCGVEISDEKCKLCYKKIALPCNDIKDNFLISNWRKMWGDFFEQTADELEVFSPSSEKIFSQAYPFLNNKIKVIPHEIKPFPKYNIAILGHLVTHKGVDIINNITNYLFNNNITDYHFSVIGIIHSRQSEMVSSYGEYNRDMLPVILKNNNTDAIFIPSIWPETFSYTTAESIHLNYPVICFDMGGQADQVRKYDKGLILSSMEPEKIIKEISEFLTDLNKNKTNI